MVSGSVAVVVDGTESAFDFDCTLELDLELDNNVIMKLYES